MNTKNNTPKTILIAGATGATGRLLTQQLLERGHNVKVIVRSAHKLPETVRTHPNITIVQASLLDLTDAQLTAHVKGCDAVASCLGHNLTFKGIYGHPRKLVTDAVQRLSQAVKANNPDSKVKFVLMNTTGNRNHDLNEQVPFADTAVVSLVRLLIPPHSDNEQAADYLRTQIGQQDKHIEWAAVRPDSLTDEDKPTAYTAHPSLQVGPIFGGGKTSRINVAHFMAELITNHTAWTQWQGQMPVIYNQVAETAAAESAV